MAANSNDSFRFDQLIVFFKHTDYHGFIHPYNFLEWTSYVREAFFQSHVPNFREVLERPIKMMTTKINLRILGEAQFGDHLEARLTVGQIKRVSFDMIIRFFNKRKNEFVGETVHTVVFIDGSTGGFAAIPDEMKKVIADFEEPKLNLSNKDS